MEVRGQHRGLSEEVGVGDWEQGWGITHLSNRVVGLGHALPEVSGLLALAQPPRRALVLQGAGDGRRRGQDVVHGLSCGLKDIRALASSTLVPGPRPARGPCRPLAVHTHPQLGTGAPAPSPVLPLPLPWLLAPRPGKFKHST